MSWISFVLYSWAIFDVWAIYFMTKTMFFQHQYLFEDTTQYKPEWLPFVRTDRKQWRYLEIYFCTIFFMYWRTLTIIFSSLTLEILLRLLFIKPRDVNKVLPPWKIFFRDLVLRNLAWCILFACGFYKIPVIEQTLQELQPSYSAKNTPKNTPQLPPICISNHITWIDTIYYVYNNRWSFLSKKQLMKAPLFGISVITLQGIFLSREERSQRSEASDQIDERIEKVMKGEKLPPIIIFPEGTVSNGDYLISFKKGAFHMMSPIKMMCLKYQKRNYNPYLCIMDQVINAFFLMAQFQNELTCYDIETIYPENIPLQSKEDWEGYAQYCKNIMAKCLNVKQSEAGYRHMKEYQAYLYPERASNSNPSSLTSTPEQSDVSQQRD